MNSSTCVKVFVILVLVELVLGICLYNFVYVRSPPSVRTLHQQQVEISFPALSVHNGLPAIPIPSVVIRARKVGLGNQLFKYAAAYSIARTLNASLFLQYKIPPGRTFSADERDFSLDLFNLNSSMASYLTSTAKVPRAATFNLTEVHYWTNSIPMDKVLMLDDYWASERYFQPFKEEIQQQFKLRGASTSDPDAALLQQISSSESVAVHFRRGDFNGQGNTSVRLLPFSYQLRAMDLMESILNLKNTTPLAFFVFSDDIQYVRSKFKNSSFNQKARLVYVSDKKRSSVAEFQLMSQCKHFIIPNSSFSWWAAYLHRGGSKVVIAPFPRQKLAFFHKYGNAEIIKYKKYAAWNHAYPKEWITLNPFESFEDAL